MLLSVLSAAPVGSSATALEDCVRECGTFPEVLSCLHTLDGHTTCLQWLRGLRAVFRKTLSLGMGLSRDTYPSASDAPHRNFYDLVPTRSLGLLWHSCSLVKAHLLCLRPPGNSSFLVLEKNTCGEQAVTLESHLERWRHQKHSWEHAPGEVGRSHLQKSSSCLSVRKRNEAVF